MKVQTQLAALSALAVHMKTDVHVPQEEPQQLDNLRLYSQLMLSDTLTHELLNFSGNILFTWTSASHRHHVRLHAVCALLQGRLVRSD